jgi:hypothetical protein
MRLLMRLLFFENACLCECDQAAVGEPRARIDVLKFFRWILYAFLVLCLVRLEPVPVVIAFQTPQEAESRFRKGWEMWAFHPSIVDIRRIAV